MFVVEQNRDRRPVVASKTVDPAATIAPTAAVRAPGRIEGLTEEIELRARHNEQVQEIRVAKGQWVQRGDVLMVLDPSKLQAMADLAAARLIEAEAKMDRIENGFRESEIETARQEAQAADARLDGAEKAYRRANELLRNEATSQQTVDDLFAELNMSRASAAAAKSRLETVSQPPREDELMAAAGAVDAARAQLEIAKTELARAQVIAPAEGMILAVEVEVGELTGPDSEQPVIIMANTSRLRCVADVDEYDVLKIQVGQQCEVSSDGTEGVLARGKIIEIEPRMHPKRMFGQWAGERSDVYSRRVWIDLTESLDLPIGLPVDVHIEVGEPAQLGD